VLLVGGLGLLIVVEELRRSPTEETDASSRYDSLATSAAATVVTLFINECLYQTIRFMTSREGHNTRTDVETSLFSKLAAAYVVNTVLLPLAVGWVFDGVTQAWYEPGGVVQRAALLTLTNAVSSSLPYVLQISPLLARLLARFTSDPHRLRTLHLPPRMPLGDMYAATVRTVSLGMVYAPLFPPAFLLSAVAMLLSFCATKVGVCYHWARPPNMGEDLLERLCTMLGLVVLLHLAVLAIGGSAAEGSDDGIYAGPVLAAALLWLVYQLAPLSFFGGFRKVTQFYKLGKADKLDTAGIRYDQVLAKKHYTVERYLCPNVCTGLMAAMQSGALGASLLEAKELLELRVPHVAQPPAAPPAFASPPSAPAPGTWRAWWRSGRHVGAASTGTTQPGIQYI